MPLQPLSMLRCVVGVSVKSIVAIRRSAEVPLPDGLRSGVWAMRTLFLFWAIWAALAAPVLADASTIPFKRDAYGRMLVPVTVDGITHDCFLFDTAARRFAIAFKEEDLNSIVVEDRSSMNFMSSSGFLRLPLAQVSSLAVGRKELGKTYVARFPKGDTACGVAGFDAYNGFVMQVDPAQSVIRQLPHSGDLAAANWQFIDGSFNRFGGMLLKTTYRGQEITVMLASGLSASLMDYKTAKLMFPDKFRKGPGYTLDGKWEAQFLSRGIVGGPKQFESLTLKDFDIQGWKLGDIKVAVTRLNDERGISSKSDAFIMIGADVLAARPYAIDTRWHQVWYPPE